MCKVTVYPAFDRAIFEATQLFVIPVKFPLRNGEIETLKLMIDTGAQSTILRETASQILEIQKLPGQVGGSGVTGRSGYTKGRVKQMLINDHLGHLALSDFEILVGSLPSACDRYQIRGILGAKTLQEFCLQLDYPKQILEISRFDQPTIGAS
jgi:Aspartyl protease